MAFCYGGYLTNWLVVLKAHPRHLLYEGSMKNTLPETNSKFAPENMLFAPKRKGWSSNHPFSGAFFAVSFRGPGSCPGN